MCSACNLIIGANPCPTCKGSEPSWLIEMVDSNSKLVEVSFCVIVFSTLKLFLNLGTS
jgi:hypothetical protein